MEAKVKAKIMSFLKSVNFSKSYLSHIGFFLIGCGCHDALKIYDAPKFSIVYVCSKLTSSEPSEGLFSEKL